MSENGGLANSLANGLADTTVKTERSTKMSENSLANTTVKAKEGTKMKQIRELAKELRNIVPAEREHDFRWRFWAKTIRAVDTNLTNGYCFVGDFIPEGSVEVEIKPQLFLVLTTNGSRANQVPHYSVVELDANGELHVTDIYTDGKTPGWALRIRDQVAAKLAELEGAPAPNPLASFSDAEILAEARRRGLIS